MRGWKVVYFEEEGLLEVGPTRGPAQSVHIVGVGTSPREEHHYLLYEASEELVEKAEEALRDFLVKDQGGAWDLVEAHILSPHWGDMSRHERDRLIRREGFEAARKL